MEKRDDADAGVTEWDARLWVRVKGVPGKCFLIGSGRSSRGLMAVWSEERAYYLSIYKTDVLASSEFSDLWIDGFLAGNEPEPESVFGPNIRQAPNTDPRWRRLYVYLDEYDTTGEWGHEPWRKVISFPPNTVTHRRFWTLRGDEVWAWDHASEMWVFESIYPHGRGGFVEDTPCWDRGMHEMRGITEHHEVCDDCGWTVFQEES